MKKGMQVLIMFVILSAIFIPIILIAGARQFSYIAYGDCVGKTLSDIDALTNQLKSQSTSQWHYQAVRVTNCIGYVVFANGDGWKTAAASVGKGAEEVKCKDDADAHILIFKRDMGFWQTLASPLSGSGREKLQAEILAPDVICRDAYGFTFATQMRNAVLPGPSGDLSIYCLKFQVDQKNNDVDITSWDTVEAREKCKI